MSDTVFAQYRVKLSFIERTRLAIICHNLPPEYIFCKTVNLMSAQMFTIFSKHGTVFGFFGGCRAGPFFYNRFGGL